MNKTTLVLVTLAAVALGLLIGVGLADRQHGGPAPAVPAPTSLEALNGAPVFRYLKPEDFQGSASRRAGDGPATVGENFIKRDKAWKSETLQIELGPEGDVEYKVFMAEGDSIVFTWQVAGAKVYFDFHAHDDAFGKEFFTRYEKGEAEQGAGSILAPYTGQHGWYWRNLETRQATVTLEVAGFYDRIEEVEL